MAFKMRTPFIYRAYFMKPQDKPMMLTSIIKKPWKFIASQPNTATRMSGDWQTKLGNDQRHSTISATRLLKPDCPRHTSKPSKGQQDVANSGQLSTATVEQGLIPGKQEVSIHLAHFHHAITTCAFTVSR